MDDNLNLEFRKIPSLQFLYEVNMNGTIIRNCKSKKRLKCYKGVTRSGKESWYTIIKLRGKNIKLDIQDILAECWYSGNIKPVTLVRDETELDFSTSKSAARYLASVYDKNEKSFTNKFHLKRKHIFDYDVIYRNAETRHVNPEGKE